VFGLLAVTRLHEVGITSNRKSSRFGEIVPKSCTHRPSHAGSEFWLKIIFNNLLKNILGKIFVFLKVGKNNLF